MKKREKMKDYSKDVVVITGASSGIGLATAKYFRDLGFIVYGLSRREIKEEKINYLYCDVTNFESVKDAIDKIIEKEKRIDLVMNNAGFGTSGSVENENLDEVKKMFDVNFFGVSNVTKCVLPFFRSEGHGKIINTSSVAGTIPIPFQSYYSATKSALDIWAKALKLEVKKFNIGVANVLVGDTKTNFTQKRIKSEKDKGSVYEDMVNSSISKMERDEQGGKDPKSVAKVVFKLYKKKKMPATKVVGGMYKFILILQKFLPQSLMMKVVAKLYT